MTFIYESDVNVGRMLHTIWKPDQVTLVYNMRKCQRPIIGCKLIRFFFISNRYCHLLQKRSPSYCLSSNPWVSSHYLWDKFMFYDTISPFWKPNDNSINRWCSQYMMTSSNGNIFSRYWPFVRRIHWWIPAERQVRRSFNIFFDLCLYKQLSIQSWGWWFETPSSPLWRH